MRPRNGHCYIGLLLLVVVALTSACVTQGNHEKPIEEPAVEPPPKAIEDKPSVPLPEHAKVVSALGAARQRIIELEGITSRLASENETLRGEIERLQGLLAQAEADKEQLQKKLDVVFSPPSPTPTENETQAEVEIYVTQPGNTFAQIAAKPEIYGNSERWQDLYETNRERLGLSKPEDLRPGMELEIKRP